MNFSSSVRRVAAVSAAGLAASVFAAVPASAVSGTLNYDCTIKELPGVPVAFTAVLDTDAPTAVAPGVATPVLNATADVTIPSSLADALRGLAAQVDGTADTTTTLDGVAEARTLTIAKVPTGAAGTPLVLKAAGPLYAVTGGAEGTTHTIAAGAFTAKVNLYKADGSAAGAFTIPCVAATGQKMTVDTLTATAGPAPVDPTIKVDSTTTAKVKYAKKSMKATVKVAVKGADGTPGTGKVKVKVKIGKKTKTVNASLNASGKAKAVFKKLGQGKYKFKVSYAGADNQNASKTKEVLKVK